MVKATINKQILASSYLRIFHQKELRGGVGGIGETFVFVSKLAFNFIVVYVWKHLQT
jgi:hypothetical protein